MNPFDYIKSINNKSQYMTDLQEYNPYITNVSFSLHNDTIFNSNKMNLNYNLSKKMQYDYYFNEIRKKYRYKPWHKKLDSNEDILCVQKYYKYNLRRTKEALAILSPAQIKIIKEKLSEGGT